MRRVRGVLPEPQQRALIRIKLVFSNGNYVPSHRLFIQIWRLKPLRFTMCVSFSWIARRARDFCGYIVPDLHLGHIDAHPRTTSRRRPRPSDSNNRAEHTTMWFSSRHTRLALALLAMIVAALAHPAAAQSVARIPSHHVEGGDSVAALALPRRPLTPRVNDATIVNQDAKDDGPAPVQAAMGEAATDPTPLRPMRPMRPADSTTTAETTTPVLTPIRPANVEPKPAQVTGTEAEKKPADPASLRPMRPLKPMRPVDHVVAGIGLDESGRVDAVEAVAAAEVALEKAEEATGGGGAARDPEAQGLLREAERVLAKAEVESERTDDDVELGGGENGAVRRGAGGSGAGMENNREYDRWYSDTPPWVLATCAGVGAGLVLIVFQTVCQGVGKGCEGASVRSLVDDDYKKPPPAKYGAAGTTPV